MTDKKNIYNAIIVGAGAAGLMASVKLNERKKQHIILEKTGKAGNKLLITGGGRANVTNNESIENFKKHIVRNGKFLKDAFNAFTNEKLISFLESKGIPLINEKGKIFPKEGKARLILNALLDETKEYAELRVESAVANVQKEGDTFTLHLENGKLLHARNVLIACGGLSYPKTGSSGKGYEIAKGFGHSIVPPKPALSGVETEENIFKALSGTSVKAKASIVYKGKKKESVCDNVLFTHFGLSGPALLELSLYLGKYIEKEGGVLIALNFLNEENEENIFNMLKNHYEENAKMSIKNASARLLPKRLVQTLFAQNVIDYEKQCAQIKKSEIQRIIEIFSKTHLKVKSLRPIEEALITEGGVNVKEIDPKTMESKLVKGLFFAGETLDVHGREGGFNLQIAFSSGYLAGMQL